MSPRCHGTYICGLALPRRPPRPTPEAGGRLTASEQTSEQSLTVSAFSITPLRCRTTNSAATFPLRVSVGGIHFHFFFITTPSDPPPSGRTSSHTIYHQHFCNSLRFRCWPLSLPRLTTCPHLSLTRTRQLRATLSLILVLLWRTRSAQGVT